MQSTRRDLASGATRAAAAVLAIATIGFVSAGPASSQQSLGGASAADSPATAGQAAGIPIVFFDIAGPNASEQQAFYREVFAWEPASDGRVSAPVTPWLDGLLRTDPAEVMLYDPAGNRLGLVEMKDGRAKIP